MSYTAVGLGYDMEVTLPYVGKETIQIPLEQMVDVATDRAMARALPPIQAEVSAAMAEARNIAHTVSGEIWTDIQPQVEQTGMKGLAIVAVMIAAGSFATVYFLRR
jgi:hypothetical protein